MADKTADERLVENEVVFRRVNESIQDGFDNVIKMAKETNQENLVHNDDTALHFLCECSDENCHKRVKMKPSTYAKVHKNRKQFVVLRGHETAEIEDIISRAKDFFVVKKNIQPPATVQNLNPTSVDNT